MFKALLNIMSALLLPFHLGLSIPSLSLLSLSPEFLRSQLRAIDACNPFHRSSSVSFFVIFPSCHLFSSPSFLSPSGLLSSSLSLSLSLDFILPLSFFFHSNSLNILIPFSFFLLPLHNATKTVYHDWRKRWTESLMTTIPTFPVRTHKIESALRF